MATCTLLLDLLVKKLFKVAASIYNLLQFYGTSVYALAGFQLSASVAWGTTWDCTTCGNLPQTFLQKEPMSWLDQPFWFSLWLQDAPQQQPSGNFEKQVLLQVLEGTQYAQGHATQSNRKTERATTRASACVWPWVGSPFVGLLFTSELKT